MKTKSSSIIITGDIYPSGACEAPLVQGEAGQVFHDLLPHLQGADFVLGNLETPLTKLNNPITKDGANLKANPKTLNGLKKAGFRAFGLANNHILDHGDKGLMETMESLKREEIDFFGAGKDLSCAAQPHIVTVGDSTIGFLAVAEHEFTIATANTYGAYGLNVPDNVRQIAALKKQVDHVVVLYHGGKEHYPYPTPNQQNISRFFVEMGADVVIAQHSHIVGAYEWYNDKFILYGQGNFLFEKLSRNYNSWFEGVLVKLTVNKGEFSVELLPYEQSKGFVGIKLMTDRKKQEVLQQLEAISKEVTSTENVAKLWEERCLQELPLYQSRLFGHNRYLRVLNRKLNFAKWWYPKWKKNMIRNVVECETHREGLETLWRQKNNTF